MKKFLVTYHATPEAIAQMMSSTPEQKAEGMKHWMAWKEKVGDQLLDFGAPTSGGSKIAQDGSAMASTNQVSGYSIIQADDMAGAQKLLAVHPHNNWELGYTIEVHECVAM